MPQAAVAIVAAVASSATSSVLGGILGSIAGAVVGGAISFAGASFFSTKPKTPDLSIGSRLSDRTQMVRQSIATRPIIYGQTAASGPVTFMNVTDGKKKLQWLITITGHPVEEIGDIWFGDTKVFEGPGTGDAIGKYAGYARFGKAMVPMMGTPIFWRPCGHVTASGRLITNRKAVPSFIAN